MNDAALPAAVSDVRRRAPLCVGGDPSLPSVVLSDGSTRRTFATEGRSFPDCLFDQLETVADAFDELEKTVVRLLEVRSGRRLQYYVEQDGEKVVTNVVDSPHKDHLHVYKKAAKASSLSSHWGRHAESFADAAGKQSDSDYLVPFHVDNGLFLIITHFPEHPLKLRLSDGRNASVDDDGAGVLVLLGRGLTEWMLQGKEEREEEGSFFAAPHAVPSMHKSSLTYRTVYARMKVAPGGAKPVLADSDGGSNVKDFDSMFMQRGDDAWSDSQVCSVRLSSRDHWVEAMDATCAQGEAYCWMGCYPLPSECPRVTDAVCFSDVTNVTCSTEPGGKPMDPTCKWQCKPEEPPQYRMSSYCNGKMDMLMFGFDVSGDKRNPCIVLFVEAWTLDSRTKFYAACVGVMALGFSIEAVIALRRTISRRRRLFLKAGPASRKAIILTLFAFNLVLGYLAMLVAMTYSVELFCFVVLGLVVGHGVFNLSSAVGDSIDPCCSAQNDVTRRKGGRTDEAAVALVSAEANRAGSERGDPLLMVDTSAAQSSPSSNGGCCRDRDGLSGSDEASAGRSALNGSSTHSTLYSTVDVQLQAKV